MHNGLTCRGNDRLVWYRELTLFAFGHFICHPITRRLTSLCHTSLPLHKLRLKILNRHGQIATRYLSWAYETVRAELIEVAPDYHFISAPPISAPPISHAFSCMSLPNSESLLGSDRQHRVCAIIPMIYIISLPGDIP